jgi:hypothetical protein
MSSVVLGTLHKPPERPKTSQQNSIFDESAKKVWSSQFDITQILEVFTACDFVYTDADWSVRIGGI